MSMYLGNTATAIAGAVTTTVFFLPLLTKSPRGLFEFLMQGGSSRSDTVSASQVLPVKDAIRDHEPSKNDPVETEEGPMSLTNPSLVVNLFASVLIHCREQGNLALGNGISMPLLPDYKMFCAFLTLLQVMAAVHRQEPSIREDFFVHQHRDESMVEEEVEELLEYFHFAALVSSRAPGSTLTKVLRPSGYKIVRQAQYQTESGNLTVYHFMAIHYKRKEVVISISCNHWNLQNTTNAMKEIATCIADNRTHQDLLEAATTLSIDIFHMLEHIVIPGGFRIVLSDHSLGAGVASLLGILWKDRPGTCCILNLQVFAFGPPPCCSQHQSIACTPYITSVINNNDCIPRLSASSLRWLERLVTNIDKRLQVWSLSPRNKNAVERSLSEISKIDPLSILQLRDLKRWWQANCCGSTMLAKDELCVPGKVVCIWNHTQDANILGVNIAECGSNAVRQLLLSEFMLYDHTLDAYRANLELLVEQTANSI